MECVSRLGIFSLCELGSSFYFTKKFLLYKIIPRAGFNLATGRFWPAGGMFDTPDIGHFLKKVVARLTEHDDVIKHCSEGPRT